MMCVWCKSVIILVFATVNNQPSRLEFVWSKQAECTFFFHLAIDFENSLISSIFKILDEELHDLHILVHKTPEHCNYSSISEWIH